MQTNFEVYQTPYIMRFQIKDDKTELESILYNNLVFDSFDENNLPFLMDILTKKANQKCGVYFEKELAQSAIEGIKYIGKIFENVSFSYSSTVAVQIILPDDSIIAAIQSDGENLSPYYINCVPPLTYAEFKRTIPEMKKIASQIRSLDLKSDIEIIIWLDNWFQENIQYIKDTITEHRYYSKSISKQSTMSDVLLHHYGTCEDIASSIVGILSLLEIPCNVVVSNGHSWVLVDIDGIKYIWDCTHNITRNDNRLTTALKATKYTNKFTLVGYDVFSGKYNSFQEYYQNVSSKEYPREKIEDCISKLTAMGIQFSYDKNPIVPTTLIDLQ